MPNTDADPSQVQELERSRRFYDARLQRPEIHVNRAQHGWNLVLVDRRTLQHLSV